ncbi:uncharacterized protein LOC141914560 [Tubulanus polymorphus]|uniref:uncharacterized protein LOC141901211 n=1 Tax=Tubulanus polymorphus TaxID=672921 RepID=UPI003DA6CD69
MAANNADHVNSYELKLNIDGDMATFSLDHETYMKAIASDVNVLQSLLTSYREQLPTASRRPAATTSVQQSSTSVQQSSTSLQQSSTTLQQSSTSLQRSSTSLQQSSTSLQQSSQSGDDSFMPRAAVLKLIDLHKDYAEKFSDPKIKKATIWKQIAHDMLDAGFDFTADQIKNKWNNLMKKYRKTVDHNNKTGVEPKTCIFYDELDAYLGCKPNVRPNFVIASTNMESSSTTTDSASNAEMDVDPFEPISFPPAKKLRKSRGSTSAKSDTFMELMEKQEESRKEDSVKLMETIQANHKEIMTLENEKLEVERKKISVFEKLLEKI